MELINKAAGKSLTQLLKQGIGGWLLAISVTAISGLQQVFDFLMLPFTLFTDVASQSVESFILTPMGLTDVGFQITGRFLDVFQFLAGPISVVIALLSIALVIVYLSIPWTSNLLPGFILDNILVSWFFGTAEEQDEGG